MDGFCSQFPNREPQGATQTHIGVVPGSVRKRQTRQGLLHRISSIEDLPQALGHRGCFQMTWSWSDQGNMELLMIRNVRVEC